MENPQHPNTDAKDASAAANPPGGKAQQASDSAPVGLSTSASYSSGIIKTRRAAAVRKAAAEFERHRLPQRGAMASKLSWFITTLFGIIFTRVEFDPRMQEKIRVASETGQLVYVFQTASFIDYLYFNWAFLQHGLPLAQFANGLSAMALHSATTWLKHTLYLRSRRKDAYDKAAFEHNIRQQQPVWIHLEKPLQSEAQEAFSQPYLLRLMELSHQDERPLMAVPMLLIWEKRPDPQRPSLIDDLFGTTQAPGFWRKLVQFLNISWQSFFIFGSPVVQVNDPLNLSEFREEVPEADTAEAAELLRERLRESILEGRQVIMGPPLQKSRDLKADILRKQAVTQAIKTVAKDENLPEADVAKRAKDQLDEIAADASLLGIKALGAALSPLFYRIYQGFHIDMDGLHRLKEVTSGSRVILIPSHKSHIDYLVLSYVFYQYGLMPPHIAAGVNLSFWPMGPIFRRNGAFFLRRTFKGDALYPTIFRQYLVKLLEERVMIEFFIEGTRSRTGKVISPRFGMLRMILDAFMGGQFDDLYFQPISIGYEKIIEGSSYRKESMGGEKEAESAASLLKASSVLISNYGRVFIEFAEPISLRQYLARYDFDRNHHTDQEIQDLTVRLGHRVVYDIAEVTPVTPTALAATIILGAPGRGISAARFHTEVGFAMHVLLDPSNHARVSAPLTEALEKPQIKPLVEDIRSAKRRANRLDDDRHTHDQRLGESLKEVLAQALKLLEQNDLIKTRKVDGQEFYEANEATRSELNYYKNNIIHFFVDEALLATALLVNPEDQHVSLDTLKERSLFLSRLFKYEFFYQERSKDDEERSQFEAAFEGVLDYLCGCGWIERQSGQIAIHPTGRTAMEFFRGLMLPYIDPYLYITQKLQNLPSRKDGFDAKDMVKLWLRQARSDAIQGELTNADAVNKQTLENVLRYLVERKALTIESVPGRRGRVNKIYRMAPQPDGHETHPLDDLHKRIETFAGTIRRKPSEHL